MKRVRSPRRSVVVFFLLLRPRERVLLVALVPRRRGVVLGREGGPEGGGGWRRHPRRRRRARRVLRPRNAQRLRSAPLGSGPERRSGRARGRESAHARFANETFDLLSVALDAAEKRRGAAYPTPERVSVGQRRDAARLGGGRADALRRHRRGNRGPPERHLVSRLGAL